MEVDETEEQAVCNKESVTGSDSRESNTNSENNHTDAGHQGASDIVPFENDKIGKNCAEDGSLPKDSIKETIDRNVSEDSNVVTDSNHRDEMLVDQKQTIQEKTDNVANEGIEINQTDNNDSCGDKENNSHSEVVDSVSVVSGAIDNENNMTESVKLETNNLEDISEESDTPQNNLSESKTVSEDRKEAIEPCYTPVSPAEPVLDDISDTEEDKKDEGSSVPSKPVMELRHMLEDIEEGELDYDDGELGDDDLPDLPEYDPSAHKIENGNASEEGEIISDTENNEREEGEIPDDEETGQVYVCVDPVNDKWKKVSQQQAQDLEEGQIDDSEEIKTASPPSQQPGRFIPRTLCKYFNNGLCRWGSTCRFLHPGINDKGIPTDVQPTWNATAGNYTMHRPPGMYPNAYGKAPPPMECINVPVLPAPGQIVDMSLYPTVPEYVVMPVGVHPHEAVPVKESAWERGLRRAKEVKEAAARRREEDADFERKKLNMRIPENEVEKEPEFEAGVDPVLSAERTLNEWNLNENKSANEYYDRRPRDERRSERYADRFARSTNKDGLDKSSGRARLAALPPSHPIRREERQRQRERERRDRDVKDSDYKIKPKPEKMDVPKRPSNEENTSSKTATATEWHDPWMRTQPPPAATTKTDVQKQSGLEAISDSDSSSSDTDSDSESSSTDKSSDSDSGSSGREKKRKALSAPSNIPQRTDVTEPKNRKERRQQLRQQSEGNAEKNEPLSYEEWKRLQNMQKAQYHHQMNNQYKNSLDQQDNRKDRHKDHHVTAKPVDGGKTEELKKSSYQQDPRIINSLSKRPPVQMTKHSANLEQPPTKLANMGNDDKFDSPKRKADSDSDSDSGSDSDSESSDSDSSDSDSEDSDSDSDSDNAMKEKPTNTSSSVVKPSPWKPSPPAVDLAVRKDVKPAVPEKVKPAEVPAVMSLAGKRPARKDELLKELKAVEDAIARKRAKID